MNFEWGLVYPPSFFYIRYITNLVILVFFSLFFRIYVNLWDTAIKYVFACVCLFFLFTITGTNEAIIVELKKLFVLKATFITFSEGSHH